MTGHDHTEKNVIGIVGLSVCVSVVASIAITLFVVQRMLPHAVTAQGPSAAFAEDAAVKQVIERARPAVVSIVVTKDVSADANFPSPLGDLVLPPSEGAPAPQGKQKIGGGSGFVIRPDGLIVTNRHVVEDTKADYSVVFSDGKELPATVVGKDPVLDIAIIKVDAQNLSVVTLGDSDALFVGETVIAIGNSLAEFQNTVTKGIVSGLSRHVIAGDDFGNGELIEAAIQTDAAINPGNSGGPMLSLAGEVVGINTAVSNQGQLIGFALPVNAFKRVLAGAITTGKIIHPWLGVRYEIITPDLQTAKKLPLDHGALIMAGTTKDEPGVAVNSPAAKAGLKVGDIMTAINGTPIDDKQSPAGQIAKFGVGDTLVITVWRDGKEMPISVMLGEFPNQ